MRVDIVEYVQGKGVSLQASINERLSVLEKAGATIVDVKVQYDTKIDTGYYTSLSVTSAVVTILYK